MKKKWIFIFLIAILTISTIMPMRTFAASQETASTLGPGPFPDVMANVTSNILIIDSYARTIRDMQDINITNISADLRTIITKQKKNARNNATDWLNTVKPQIMKTNQEIVTYNDTFQAHYNTLLIATEQQDTVKIETELKQLYESILQKKEQVNRLIGNLTTFRNKMTDDTKNFKNSANQLASIVASTHTGIPFLQSEINRYHALIKTGNILIGTGSGLCALIIGCIAGGPMIADGVNKKKEANREIEKLTARISGIEKEIALLTDVQNKITNMTDTIDDAITSLQNVANNWHTIGSKYYTLWKNVNVISPEDFIFIKEDLQTAKDSWNELKTYADRMNQAIIQAK
jgi:non-hemolytic enterotoxin B/C